MASTVTELLRRRFGGKKGIVNLLNANYCDLPNGSHSNPQQYYFALYPIDEQLAVGTQVHIKIVLKDYENKTSIRFYNSSSASGASIGYANIVDGVAEGDFTWINYSTNNTLRCYAYPSNNSYPVPTASHAELYTI